MLDRAREDLRTLEKVVAEIGRDARPARPRSCGTHDPTTLATAGELSAAFLGQLIAVLENRRAEGAASAMQKTERYYSTFQTPQSAQNAARLIWSVLQQGE